MAAEAATLSRLTKRRCEGLRGAHPGEELVDLAAQRLGLLRELGRGAQHLARRRAGLRGCLGHAGNVGRDLLGAGRRLLAVAADLARRDGLIKAGLPA